MIPSDQESAPNGAAAFEKLIEDAQKYHDLDFLNNQEQQLSSSVPSTVSATSTDDDNSTLEGETPQKQRRNKRDKDYRGFAFCIHPKYGMLLLHCTRKKKKGPHYQVPGGHVDDNEFQKYASTSRSWKQQRYYAARAGCLRELYEETGINIQDPERLLPLALNESTSTYDKDDKKKNKELLINEYKHRLFFVVTVTDQDFYQEPYNFQYAQNYRDCPLRLKLSVEHSGFRLEPSPTQCIQLLHQHSGGNVAYALQHAFKKD